VDYTTSLVVLEAVGVSAGIGPYNYSQAFDYQPEYIAYFFTTTFSNLLGDPRQGVTPAPLCPGNTSDCISFYFPGGLGNVSPAPDAVNNSDKETDVWVVHNVQGIQVDFWYVDQAENESINQTDIADCPTYGGNSSAFTICIAPSSLHVDHFIIRMFPKYSHLLIKFGTFVLLTSLRRVSRIPLGHTIPLWLQRQ